MSRNKKLSAVAVAVSLALSVPVSHASPRPQADFTNPNAIIGGDTQAIIGGDRAKAKRPNAIIGGDTQAIIGGDTQAIIGGDTQAIIGGDRAKAKRPNAIIGGDHFLRFPPEVLIWGPLSSIDLKDEVLTVLGQQFSAKGNRSELKRLQAQLESGQQVLIAVRGKIGKSGEMLGTTVRIFDQPRLHSNDTVLVSGRVDKLDESMALLSIGGLSVDYSAILSTSPVDIGIGDFIAIVATHSGTDELITADAIKIFRTSR